MGLIGVTQILRDNKSHYEIGGAKRDFKLRPEETMNYTGPTKGGCQHLETQLDEDYKTRQKPEGALFPVQGYYKSCFLSTRRSQKSRRRS